MEMCNKTGISSNVIDEICNLAKGYGVEKVILFGSRARGDYKRTSDIDLAFTGGDSINFALDIEEKTSTLLCFDIVYLDFSVQAELQEAIQKDGVVLYEKI